MAKKPQLWSGRFKEPVDEQVKRFTASVGFDQRLAKQDIRGSLAHARMLAACGILSRRDLTAIERGLARVGREIDRGRFKWSLEAEDVHFNIERRLTALVGEAGKRLHTARSRAPASRSTARAWRASSASRACARTRSTRSPTATSRSSSAPMPR